MTRLLTQPEIENMLNFIQPQKGIPYDTAMSVVNIQKERLRVQLKTQKVYPEIIPALKDEIEKVYYSSIIDPGESVGVICAQSIGEKQTQTTLNSVDWKEKLLYTKNGNTIVEPIGKMIDRLLTLDPDNITKIEENRTEYLPLPEGYMIPSCDENGNTNWYRIEAVTRHLPVGKLVRVVTQSGRTVTATQSKSFLVWNGTKFEGVLGSDVKVGDMLPTTTSLRNPSIEHEYLTIFPKNKYKILLENDFGFLIGIYLAKGWCTKTFVGIRNNDEVIQKRITDWCDRYGFAYQHKNILKIYSTLLARIFKIVCNTGSANKQVPEFAYTAPDEFIKGLIDGYWMSCDGTFNKEDDSVSVCSISENLILGISFLLSYFGIFGTLSNTVQNKNNLGSERMYTLSSFFQEFAKLNMVTYKSQDEVPVRDVYFDEVLSVEYVDGTTKYVYVKK